MLFVVFMFWISKIFFHSVTSVNTLMMLTKVPHVCILPSKRCLHLLSYDLLFGLMSHSGRRLNPRFRFVFGIINLSYAYMADAFGEFWLSIQSSMLLCTSLDYDKREDTQLPNGVLEQILHCWSDKSRLRSLPTRSGSNPMLLYSFSAGIMQMKINTEYSRIPANK